MKKKEYKKNEVWQNDSKGDTIVHNNIRLKESIEKNLIRRQLWKIIFTYNTNENFYMFN